MVDTCCDPTDIDYVIPANDDATKSIAVVVEAMCAAIAEGTEERKLEKEKEAQEADAEGAVKKEGKPRIKKAVKAASMPRRLPWQRLLPLSAFEERGAVAAEQQAEQASNNQLPDNASGSRGFRRDLNESSK